MMKIILIIHFILYSYTHIYILCLRFFIVVRNYEHKIVKNTTIDGVTGYLSSQSAYAKLNKIFPGKVFDKLISK